MVEDVCVGLERVGQARVGGFSGLGFRLGRGYGKCKMLAG